MRSNKLLNLLLLTILLSLSSCVYLFSYRFVGKGSPVVKTYDFIGVSKLDLNNQIQSLYVKRPEIKPDSVKFKYSMIHNYINLDTPDSRKWNSDTVNFHFVLTNLDSVKVFFWTRFVGLQEDWNNKDCKLILKEYEILDENPKRINQSKVLKMFEEQILSKLPGFVTLE
jgi:hypothetical protein